MAIKMVVLLNFLFVHISEIPPPSECGSAAKALNLRLEPLALAHWLTILRASS